MDRKVYRSFDEYVADYPEAERYRVWLTDLFVRQNRRKLSPAEKAWETRGPRPVVLVPAWSFNCGLPGGYYWIHIEDWQDQWLVHVNDNDDGHVKKTCSSQAEASQEMENLVALSPFCLSDLRDFGYGDP